MSAISLPEPLLSEPPHVFHKSPPLDAALDHFSTRRRSPAIGEQFWRLAAGRWPEFNPVERTRWVRLFSRYRPYWTPEALAPDDRAFYDRLPDEFSVYRGQNGVELAASGSFTLCEKAARGCAVGRRGIAYADPRVLALKVAKRDVALAFASRDEDQIVLFPALWNAVRPQALRAAPATH